MQHCLFQYTSHDRGMDEPRAILSMSSPLSKRRLAAPVQLRRDLVVIPTYNEQSNLTAISQAVLVAAPSVDLLIVDDCSPDGTGQLAEKLAKTNERGRGYGRGRIHVLHRRGPRGLGAAYMAGFRWALREGYQRIVQMDADFSHDPAMIPALLKLAETNDLVIGSRYCHGGRTVGWPRRRQWLSFSANLYARSLLGSRIHDLTAGFRCWRRELLEHIDFASLTSDGYEFQVEMGYLAELAGSQTPEGVRICEVPITFTERHDGTSKMTPQVAKRAAWNILYLGWNRLCGRRHVALLPRKTKPKQRTVLPLENEGCFVGGIKNAGC